MPQAFLEQKNTVRHGTTYHWQFTIEHVRAVFTDDRKGDILHLILTNEPLAEGTIKSMWDAIASLICSGDVECAKMHLLRLFPREQQPVVEQAVADIMGVHILGEDYEPRPSSRR